MRKKLHQVRHIVMPPMVENSTADAIVNDNVLELPLEEEEKKEDACQTPPPVLLQPCIGSNTPPADVEDDEVVEVISYHVDESGVAKLPDGTIVVEPTLVEDNYCPIQANGGLISSTGAGDRPTVFQRPAPSASSIIPPTAAVLLDNVKCTRCSSHLNPYQTDLHPHPVLGVILCSDCHKYYVSHSRFQRDPKDNKDYQCRWCCGYGDLYCCDLCHNSFCGRCIKRNLGREVLLSIRAIGEQDVWKCFQCDFQPLAVLRSQCEQILSEVGKYRKSQQLHKERSSRLRETSSHLITEAKKPISVTGPGFMLPPLGREVLYRGQKRPHNAAFSSSSTQSDMNMGKKPSAVPTIPTTTKSAASASLPPPSSSSASSQFNKVHLASCNGAATDPGGDGDCSLSWLYDNSTVNTAQLHMMVFGALRNVAAFYRDLHRLQLSVNRCQAPFQKEKVLKDFRNTFHDHFVQRLGCLPKHLSESDRTPFKESTFSTAPFKPTAPGQQQQQRTTSGGSHSKALPLTIDLTSEEPGDNDNDDEPEVVVTSSSGNSGACGSGNPYRRTHHKHRSSNGQIHHSKPAFNALSKK